MTTDEALKTFVETCDRKTATLDEMINAYKTLEATIRYPLSCDYALKNASQIEKLDTLISFYAVEQGRLFVKFVNIPTDENSQTCRNTTRNKRLIQNNENATFHQ